MKILLFLAVALFGFWLCACGDSPPPVNTAANTRPTPFPTPPQTLTPKPVVSKSPAASPTPCEGTYTLYGVNGAPDEIVPCPPVPIAATPSPKIVSSPPLPKMKNASRPNANEN